MKTIIKLLIAAAVINACARIGLAAWGYYQLKDETHELAMFAGTATLADLHDQIVNKAVELDLPLDPANVTVDRDGRHVMVQARYAQPVELFPGYTYAIPFSIDDDVLSNGPGSPTPANENERR